METKVSCCIHWRGKQKYQITNIGVKSSATKWTKLKIKYHNKFKIVLANGNCKLFWGKTQTWNTHTARIISYQVFVRSYSAKGKRPIVDYQGREQQGWGPVWLLHQSHKLYSALSEIVSLVHVHIRLFAKTVWLCFHYRVDKDVAPYLCLLPEMVDMETIAVLSVDLW